MMSNSFIKHLFVLVFFVAITLSWANAETRTMCSSGCDHDSCASWITYLETQSPLAEPQIVEVESMVSGQCDFSDADVVTSSDNYVEMRGVESCRHRGFYEAGKCGISYTGDLGTISTGYQEEGMTVAHLRIYDLLLLTQGVDGGIFLAPPEDLDVDYRLDGIVVRSIDNGGSPVGVFANAYLYEVGSISISNLLVQGAGNPGTVLFAGVALGDAELNVYSSTFVEGGSVLNEGHGGAFNILPLPFFGSYSAGTLRLKNLLVISGIEDIPDFEINSDYAAKGVYSHLYSSDSTGSTTNVSVEFIDPDNDDYRLKATDTDVIDVGLNLTNDVQFPVTQDIGGISRPQGSAFDVGAHEWAPPQVVERPDGLLDRFLRRPCNFCRWW